eukprot:SAG31_NODE_37242_length_306_cov_0.618357_1_plen_31_part_01
MLLQSSADLPCALYRVAETDLSNCNDKFCNE